MYKMFLNFIHLFQQSMLYILIFIFVHEILYGWCNDTRITSPMTNDLNMIQKGAGGFENIFSIYSHTPYHEVSQLGQSHDHPPWKNCTHGSHYYLKCDPKIPLSMWNQKSTKYKYSRQNKIRSKKVVPLTWQRSFNV